MKIEKKNKKTEGRQLMTQGLPRTSDYAIWCRVGLLGLVTGQNLLCECSAAGLLYTVKQYAPES